MISWVLETLTMTHACEWANDLQVDSISLSAEEDTKLPLVTVLIHAILCCWPPATCTYSELTFTHHVQLFLAAYPYNSIHY